MSGFNLYFLLSALLLVQYASVSYGQKSKCTLNNGRCTYRIQLLDTCENPNLLQNTIAGLVDNTDSASALQNEQRLVELESKVAHAQTHCSKKISELETKVNELTELLLFQNADADSYRGARIYGIPTGSRAFERTDNDVDNMADYPEPGRPEIKLLNQVQFHFAELRAELEQARRRLAELERQLSDAHAQLAASADAHSDASDRLLTCEMQLSKAETDRQTAQLALEHSERSASDFSRAADSCQVEAADNERALERCQKDLYHSREQAWNAAELQRETRDELSKCRRGFEAHSRARDKAEEGQQDLLAQLTNLTSVHLQTVRDLLECNNRKTSSYCGFEDPNLCGYTNEARYDDLDWKQWGGPSPGYNTGPLHDHTCSNERGQYMYLSGIGRDQRARLMSPKFRGASEQCIEFYYFMYGAHIGILNVNFKVDGWEDNDLPPPVWRAIGDQGKMWTLARLSAPVEVVRDGYQVVFEGRTTGGLEGDLAIDDVRIFDGPCQGALTLEQVNVQRYNLRLDERNRG